MQNRTGTDASLPEMIDLVYGTGDQLRWAADLVLPELPPADDVILAGMGGSGLAARVGALTVPATRVTVVQGYELPAWATTRRPLFVAVSYSGNTEETLAAAKAGLDAGLPLVAITTGGELGSMAAGAGSPIIEIPAGLQPRVALAYQAGAVTRTLAAVSGALDAVGELRSTADLVDGLLAGGAGPSATLGRDLADAMYGRITVIYGGRGIGFVAASRWKAQINENAKMLAFASEVPELDHNELEGWSTLDTMSRRTVALVTLRDPGGHGRIDKRMLLTSDVIKEKVAHVGEVIAQGESALDRFFSLAVVGDVASVTLADLAAVDPTPVALLEDFKKRLRGD